MLNEISNMNGRTMYKLRRFDADKNWHGIFAFKKILATLTDQAEPVACMLVSLLAKHWRYCVGKSCCYRRNFHFQKIDKLYRALILKYPQNIRLQIDRVRFRYAEDAKKYIEAIKKIVNQTGKMEYNAIIGHAYAAQKKYKLARKYFLLAAPFIMKHYGIYYALAKNAQSLKDKKAEIKYAKMALARFKLMPQKYHRDPVTRGFVKELQTMITKRVTQA